MRSLGNMQSTLDCTNEPALRRWLLFETRLLLAVLAVTAVLALGVTKLQHMAGVQPVVAPAPHQVFERLHTTASDLIPNAEIFLTGTAAAGSAAPAPASTATDALALSKNIGARGQAPGSAVGGVVGIAHRGASAELPEHTREAYELAVAEGADFIECDVVLTRDLVPLCRHEPNLVGSTDAAAKFPDRWRNYTIDGEEVYGIFSVDLTAAEVATLRAVQPWPFRNQSYNGRFRVATLADYLDVAVSANRSVGIYPETKHPSWTNSLPALRAAATSLEDILLASLAAAGFGAPLGSEAWRRRPVFLQSFEAGSLRYLAAHTCAPTVLLLGDWEGWVAPESGLTLEQLVEEPSLEEIAVWAAAVGPAKGTLVDWQPEATVARAEEGRMRSEGALRRALRAEAQAGGWRGGNGGRYVSSGLVERFHRHGLQVHTYTLRPESRFFLPHLLPDGGGPAADVNVTSEYQLLLGPSGAVAVDGVFADHMPSLRDWLQHRTGGGGSNGRSREGSRSGDSDSSGGIRQRRQQRAEQEQEHEQGQGHGQGKSVSQRHEHMEAGSGALWLWRKLLVGVASGARLARGAKDLLLARVGASRPEGGAAGEVWADTGLGRREVIGGKRPVGPKDGGVVAVRRAATAEHPPVGGGQLGTAGSRPGWLGPGGVRKWSQELQCHLYFTPPDGG